MISDNIQQKEKCMKKLYLGQEKKQKKQYGLTIAFFVLLIFFILLIYFNINYFVFKILMSSSYTDYDSLVTVSQSESNSKNVFSNFDNTVISLYVKEVKETNNDKYIRFYNPEQYKTLKENIEEIAKKSEIKQLSEDTIYLKLTNISTYTRKFVFEHQEELSKYEHIIIDLRENGGGDLREFVKIASLFVDKNKILYTEKYNISFFNKTYKNKSEKYFHFKKIDILQNKNTASSAECFINALKENLENVTLIGEKTFGKGIGQCIIKLKGGYAIKATTFKLYTPKNESIHQVGINPDIEDQSFQILENEKSWGF